MKTNGLSCVLLVCCFGFTTVCKAADAPLKQNSNASTTVVQRENARLLTADYARFRKQQVSKPTYQLQLDIAADSSSFSGKVRIDFELATANTSPLTIDFDSGTITELTINGSKAAFEYERWFITLPAASLQAGSNTISIAYERPYATDGAGLHRFTDPENGEVYLYTNFEPYDANRLFPHFDQPNLKSLLTLEVTAPANWQVIANTRESSITSNGDKQLWVFPETAPLSSYVYAMHAGPFKVWESTAGNIDLRLFARTGVASFVNTEEWFQPTQDSFAFFQKYFDIAYPFGKYDQIIVPDFNAGAMENAGAVTFSERYLSRGVRSTAQKRSLASVIAHEMAHMWFGDLVTMDWWNGLWLNESFATYMANLALEAAGTYENIWDSFYTGNKLWAYDADQSVTTHPIELEVPSTADAFTNFDGITYGKGGSVLKQLPYYIGKENFRQGVSSYLKQHAYGNTTLDNFVAELAAASGIELEQWKQEWLYKSGVNSIQAEFTCNDNRIVSLNLIQTEPEASTADKILRTQRTQVGLYRYTDAQMITTAVIPVTYQGASTQVTEATGQPCPDLVLPNEADWAYMKISLDPVSLASAREHINDIANATTRLMLWQSLWDSVQDSKLALSDYISFVLQNAGAETDDNVLRLITGNIGSAVSYLKLFDAQDNQQAALEAKVFQQLQQATPASEAQKIWLDQLLGLAFSPDGLAYLHDLLNGVTTLEGLPIDQDKRWSIIRTFNRYHYADYEALLASERERDPSDQGVNMAIASEVIRPDAAVKAHWLNLIISQPDSYKLATMRIIMGSLYPAEQHALEQASAELILAAIPDINAHASQEYLGEFTSYMGTATCTEQSVARLAQANADFAGMQPLVVKTYLIHHQEDERCLKMKALMR